MNKKVFFGMSLFVFFLAGCTYQNNNNSAISSNVDSGSLSAYSVEEVSTHNSTDSCWSIINGNVYDLTKRVNQHPGGAGAIKKLCGIDGTEMFQGKHGGQENPENTLKGFLIGILK